MADKITQFSETLTSVEFENIIEIGKSLGIVSYNPDMDNIKWVDFPDKADGKIGPLVDKNGHFWYFIEFTNHSLSNDHIQSSIDDARKQAISSKLSNNRKRLLIICQHDDDAVLVDRKINENFAHDSQEQSNNPHVYVIRWSGDADQSNVILSLPRHLPPGYVCDVASHNDVRVLWHLLVTARSSATLDERDISRAKLGGGDPHLAGGGGGNEW